MSTPELTPPTAALFPLAAGAQREENICSMVNFAPEYRRLMDVLRITRIVEIGSEAGVNTQVLLGYARSRGAKLVAVDPADVHFPFDAEKEPDFTFFRGTSAEFLAAPLPAEAVFLDGDHNYETVLADLETIFRSRAATGIKLLFLHDVSWPWARRDIYYDPARISRPHAFHAENTASPYVAGSPGLPPAGYVTADAEGGPGNGVLTAVEEFLARHDGWEFRRLPVLYGIGILVCRENLAPGEEPALRPLLDELDSHRELLSVLELNRVENLCRIAGLNGKLQEAAGVWRRDQAYIGELDKKLKDAEEAWRKDQAYIGELGKKLKDAEEAWHKDQAYIGELGRKLKEVAEERDRKLREAADIWRRNQAYIKELGEKLKEVSDERDALKVTIAERDRQLQDAAEVWHKDQIYIREVEEKLKNVSAERDTLGNKAIELERSLRQLSLSLPTESWRCRDSLFRRLLPRGLRNRRRLNAARQLLDSGAIAVLSLDIFDTLLLRDRTAELERFAGTAKCQASRFPRFSPRELYDARALAHRLAYQSVPPVQGCREASAERIFTIMARILGLPADAIPALMEEELKYESAHLRPDPVILDLAKTARGRGIPVIAVSDMYWGGRDLSSLLERLLPAGQMPQKVYSSSDFGVSKASGMLFDHVLRELGCAPEALLHLGDDFQADFLSPFVRHGIRSVWLPGSSLRNRYRKFKQSCRERDLHERNIFHGL
ncbi:MAG: class I SAM-dependent methyltransferase [Lentisphaeria bacterium]|nr:class I SAM-dependent methyltransferase [Lentisphaeria bacterium]